MSRARARVRCPYFGGARHGHPGVCSVRLVTPDCCLNSVRRRFSFLQATPSGSSNGDGVLYQAAVMEGEYYFEEGDETDEALQARPCAVATARGAVYTVFIDIPSYSDLTDAKLPEGLLRNGFHCTI